MNSLRSTATVPIASAGPKHAHDEERPPRQNLGGRDTTLRDASRLERVATLAVFGFGTYLEPHSPAEHTGDKASHRVCLPARRFHQIRPGRAAGPLQQGHALRGLTPLAGSGALLGRLGGTRPVVCSLCPSSPLWPLSLGRRDTRRVCRNTGLFGCRRRRCSLGSVRIRGCFPNISHFGLSLSGDYRDHISPSPSRGLQAESLQRWEGGATW